MKYEIVSVELREGKSGYAVKAYKWFGLVSAGYVRCILKRSTSIEKPKNIGECMVKTPEEAQEIIDLLSRPKVSVKPFDMNVHKTEKLLGADSQPPADSSSRPTRKTFRQIVQEDPHSW